MQPIGRRWFEFHRILVSTASSDGLHASLSKLQLQDSGLEIVFEIIRTANLQVALCPSNFVDLIADLLTTQLGGSDQWGNITAGCDLVRKRLGGEEVYGVTVPLLTTASGEKFGKSVGNAVWLDAAKTSPYHLYQYFVNTADADVARLLRLFTFMPLSEIESLMSEHMTAPEQFAAQKTLAAHATRMLHGDAGLEFAQRVTEVLFGKSRHLPLTEMKISAHEWLAVFGSLPSTSVPRAEFERGINVLDLAVHCGAFDNKGMAFFNSFCAEMLVWQDDSDLSCCVMT